MLNYIPAKSDFNKRWEKQTYPEKALVHRTSFSGSFKRKIKEMLMICNQKTSNINTLTQEA